MVVCEHVDRFMSQPTGPHIGNTSVHMLVQKFMKRDFELCFLFYRIRFCLTLKTVQ